MSISMRIDGTKNDIRVTCISPTDSEDAGLVEGVPIDPPDEQPGWILLGYELETDTIQEKGEKGQLITRKTDPRYHCWWARPKTKVRKTRVKRKAKAPEQPSAGSEETSEEPPAADVAPPAAPAAPKPPRQRKAKTKAKKKAKSKGASAKNGAAQQTLPEVTTPPTEQPTAE